MWHCLNIGFQQYWQICWIFYQCILFYPFNFLTTVLWDNCFIHELYVLGFLLSFTSLWYTGTCNTITLVNHLVYTDLWHNMWVKLLSHTHAMLYLLHMYIEISLNVSNQNSVGFCKLRYRYMVLKTGG